MKRPCMTPDEVELWEAQAEYVRQWGQSNTADPCFDCIPSFAAEMRAVGRCNGTPGEAEPTDPQTFSDRRLESRRESNRQCQQRYRERHQDKIRERRRAYFEERWRKRFEVDAVPIEAVS